MTGLVVIGGLCSNHGCPNNPTDSDEPELHGTTFLCETCEEERWAGVLEEPFAGSFIPKADVPFQAAA